MNEKFLDKLFKIYTIISNSYAKKQDIEKFLISSYYKDKDLLYPYEYIDFELMYRMNNKMPHTLNVSGKNMVMYIAGIQVEFTDMALFLYEMQKKITDNLKGITEKDILKLNEYYKQIL